MEYLLETRQLTKVYSRRAVVDHVNMHVERGDIYGLIGRNGAGKTTIMRMILSMAFPTEGEIFLFGDQVKGVADKRVGSLIEAPGIYPVYTAEENMKMFCTLYGVDFSRINPILDYVGLGNVGSKKAGQFSLGMKQRLGIAIALLGDPELIILDEPVNGLDPAGMKDVRELIIRLNKERGVTFLISSHLLDELQKMVTKYGIINNGVLVEEVTNEEIERRCVHKLVITVDDVLKASNIIAGIVPVQDMQIVNNQILLGSHIEMSAEINKRLIENGIMVSGCDIRVEGMEQYFVDRIGGSHEE